MKFILLSDYYEPIVKSGSIIVGDLVEELLKKGHEVTVITFVEKQNTVYRVSILGRLKIIRIRLLSRKFGRAGRLLAEMRYSRMVIKSIQKYDDIKCDTIICYSPSIFYGKSINWLKKKFNAKSYLILRDIFPRWALDAGLIKEGFLYDYFKYVESILYKSADIIGVEAKKDLDFFKKIRLHKSIKVEVLNNWGSNLSINNQIPNDFPLDESKVNIVYGGNMGSAQDLLSLIKLIDISILENRAKIYLFGSGNQYDEIKRFLIEKNISNIVLNPILNRDIYLSILAKADIGLFSLNKKITTNNYPLKMIGYMQLSKPVLAHVNLENEIIQMIESKNIGLVSVASDGESFNKNLDSLITNNLMREEQGQNAYKLFEESFSVRSATSQILNHFQ